MEDNKSNKKPSSDIKKKKTTGKKKIESNNNQLISEPEKAKVDSKETTIKDSGAKKEKKTTFNLLEVIIIMIITALFGAFIGSSVVYFKYSDQKEVKIENKDLNEFVTTYNRLLNDYYNELDKDKLLDAGIKGMIDYLDDPYSSYMDTETSEEFNEEIDGNYVGMGVEIQKKDDKITIVTIFEDSPASKAGFKLGDVIVKVGNKDIKGMSTEEVSKLIKGKEGTKIKVTVNRNNDEKELELTRASVEISSVSSDIIEQDNKKIGYLKINLFAKNTGVQFEQELNKIKKSDVKGIIIDVRGNSGGYLSVVTEVVSHFLDNNDVVYQLETRGVVKKVYAMSVAKTKLPVAVLIDGGSASASEILASSLNENNNSELIGVKTYGKGTVQKALTLESGATIKYTIQSWLTSKGNKIDKVGINPTKKVELNKAYYDNPTRNNDNQLQEAINSLLK